MMDNLVRREDVYNILSDWMYDGTDNRTLNEVVEIIPSAQPETNCSEFPNNSDLISRQAAIDAARKWYEGLICGSFKGLEKQLQKLPSAQPERKTWRWIGIDDEPCDVYECEQCGTTYDTVDRTWDLPKYCPNCGAKMEKENEVYANEWLGL